MQLQRLFKAALAAALMLLAGGLATAQVPYKVVTASERGTYIKIGRDIAQIVAPEAGIELEVLPSAGSAENVRRLRYEPGVKLAMVQSDVYQAFLDMDAAGNAEAGALVRPLRVVMPLYNEEIYFITRADSKLNYLHEIKDAKINVGPLLSGTAMSATTLYKQMFGTAIPDANASFLTNEEALVKLTGDRSIDVVVVVAGQPAKLLADMQPEARKLVKLLEFDRTHATPQAVLSTYFPAVVRAASYPNILSRDIQGVAVKAFLVTFDFRTQPTSGLLARLGRSFCHNFGRLQSEGHPKWREVDLTLPELGRGWRYYTPAAREIKACATAAPQNFAKPNPNCTQQERILGLCR
jgi:TRAP transporter TAXI family solute receptor